MDTRQVRKPQHPGEFLQERYLEPRGITHYDLAKTLHVTEATITRLVHAEEALTIGLAVRLARIFNTTAQEWIKRQKEYDAYFTDRGIRHRSV